MADLLPEHPDFLWRNPEPKKSYDAVIDGGGGHGLATAYYLASRHGMTNIAILERGWLAGGNMARNTTIIRSNYLWDESSAMYEAALKLWEGMEEELGYDVFFSQRGVLNLAHNLGDVREAVRRVHANRLNGVDAVWLDADGVKEVCPIVDTSAAPRYPVLGGDEPLEPVAHPILRPLELAEEVVFCNLPGHGVKIGKAGPLCPWLALAQLDCGT